MDDIINLMVRLADDDGTRIRYQETIDAAEYYDLDPEITHTVAGQVMPILTPVQEICRFESHLPNQRWDYVVYDGGVYPCWATDVDVCQTLIQTESGYERCLKARISGLSICHHGTGWTTRGSLMKGFPGIVTCENGNVHTLNLFVSQEHYAPDQLAWATAEVVDMNRVDLNMVMADIIAER